MPVVRQWGYCEVQESVPKRCNSFPDEGGRNSLGEIRARKVRHGERNCIVIG